MAITTINENDYIKDSREVINNNFTELNNGKLSLSGGTMTGAITSTNSVFAKKDVSNSFISLYGGTSTTDGAVLCLSGKDRQFNANSFMLEAHDGTNTKILQGYANGTLTWNGNNVITSANAVSTNSSSASGDYYSYPVPTGKVFANFKTLGGKTIAWNQVFDLSWFLNMYPSATSTGLHFTRSDDGVFHITGAGTANPSEFIFILRSITILKDHKYIIATKMLGSDTVSRIRCIDKNTLKEFAFVTTTSETPFYIFTADADYNSVKYYFQSIIEMGEVDAYVAPFFADLTLMFGAGNEPTVAEFESMFPASYYAYNAGTLLSAGIKEVIAKDSSNNVVATMPIPSAVQSLEGYGWSAGSVKNEIDFVNKKFIKRVGKIVVDGNTLKVNGGGVYYENYRFNTTNANTGVKSNTHNMIADTIVMDKGSVISHEQANSNAAWIYNSNEIYILMLASMSITTVSAMNTWLQSHPITIYYELATPVETDISSILGATGIACGNTLTFDYNTNYRLPVPVSMDMLDGTNGLMTAQDKAKLDVAYQGTNQKYPYLPLSGGTLTGEVNGVTPTAGDNSTKLATTAFVKTVVDVIFPIGVVQAFAGTTIPTGWLLCDGSAVSRTTYAKLFACIGTTYGSGDGSTTFNVPNLIDKFVEGSATAGTEKSAGLPNITGYFDIRKWNSVGAGIMTMTGAFNGGADGASGIGIAGNSTAANAQGVTFNASRSSSIYGNSDTVQPPALTMRYIIKY